MTDAGTLVQAFGDEFDKAIARDVEKSGLPLDDWLSFGPRNQPRQQVQAWRELGPALCENFVDWYRGSDYQIWITPDGRPAIELELRPVFGEIQLVMYVDLVLYNSSGLVVVDTKSGRHLPETLQQTGLYASGIELTYGPQWRPMYGTYFMARGTPPKKPKGAPKEWNDDGHVPPVCFQPPVPLTGYEHSVEFWTNELAMFDRGVKSSIFVASPGRHCFTCDVSLYCPAVGGDRAVP